MKKFVSINCKYYKHSNRNEIGHVTRMHNKVENSKPELVPNNFGSSNHEEIYNKIYNKVEKYKGKKIQKNANTFVDGVVAFNRERINELIELHGREKFQAIMSQKFDELLFEMKEVFGFEPIGYKFHADEGHYKGDEWLENYHAHITLFNFNFKDGTAPLRKMQKRSDGEFSLMQDLVYKVFRPLGFERGISKDLTKKEHLDKDDFIRNKQLERINLLELNIVELNNQINLLKKVESKVSKQFHLINTFKEEMRDEFEKLNHFSNLKYEYEKVFNKLNDSGKKTVQAVLAHFLKNIDKDVALKVESFISSGDKEFNNNQVFSSSDEQNKFIENLQKSISALTLKADNTKLEVEKYKTKYKL